MKDSFQTCPDRIKEIGRYIGSFVIVYRIEALIHKPPIHSLNWTRLPGITSPPEFYTICCLKARCGVMGYADK
jgi:hypothetical protein